MAHFDFSPLFRSSIGFDRLAQLAEAAARTGESASYPPYDIVKTGEDRYSISLAVAGFEPEELDVEVNDGVLTITGRKRPAEEDGTTVLYRGIAKRDFVRRYQLADHVHVTGATLENGLLTVTLVRELPETAKPRRITITTANAAKAAKAAKKAA